MQNATTEAATQTPVAEDTAEATTPESDEQRERAERATAAARAGKRLPPRTVCVRF